MTDGEPVILRGEAHRPGGSPEPATVTLTPDGFDVAVGSKAPWVAAYRDVRVVAVDAGAVLVVLGDGPGAERWLFERFGERLGTLARGLRDGRLRQVLADGLVEEAGQASIDLVEYAAGSETGIAQLLYHDRGVVLAPLDERRPWLRVRRADIGTVELLPAVGGVRVEGASGRRLVAGVTASSGVAGVAGVSGAAPPSGVAGSTAISRIAGVPDVARIELLRLGQVTGAHRDRWAALRDGAATDAAAIVAGLVPDAPLAVRRIAAAALPDGRPATPSSLGDAWQPMEAATLGLAPFAESYRGLRELGGGDGAPRWLALAPTRPGTTDDPKTWFFVGLPGNLVALELVSAGAHATYLFRVVPRDGFTGTLPAGSLDATVAGLSDALIDARFLREPMAIPAARLSQPAYLRYRLALAALPSLTAARARFVARIVHDDPERWTAAARDLIHWHGLSRDDRDEWPGRAAQEAEVAEAADDDGAGRPG